MKLLLALLFSVSLSAQVNNPTATISTPVSVANGGTNAATAAAALTNLGAATSIRSLPACTSSTDATNLPCMLYLSGQTTAIAQGVGVTVTLPSVINGVTCTTTPSSCVVKLTGIVHTTSAFTGTSPTALLSIGPYNGTSTTNSGTVSLTNTSASTSITVSFLDDVTTRFTFIYSTTFGGSVSVAGTYEVMILVE